MNTRTNAKDFFLHVGVIASLYVGTIALLNLLFTVINTAFPRIDRFYGSQSVSLPVAVVLVAFPLFLVLSNTLHKSYKKNPENKEFFLRKWLVYLTLFVAGAVLAGDLVSLIYYFLDGRELTTGFILKVLAVFVVIGAIFGYYLDDLKGRLTGNRRNIWRVVATILVVGSIILGFSVLGTPASQRMARYDAERVNDLSSIQWQIVNHWQQKGGLPTGLTQLEDSISGYRVPVDPKTKESYEYNRADQLTFELCANFETENLESQDYSIARPVMEGRLGGTWAHSKGRECFTRNIDPELYPVRTR